MANFLNTLEGDDGRNGKTFKFLTFLLVQFLLVSLDLVVGFMTDSMVITANIGFHLATIFLIGNKVAKDSFPDIKASKVGRVAVLIFFAIMSLVFSAIVISEFFARQDSPVVFSEASVFALVSASLISMILSYLFSSHLFNTWKEIFMPIVVFVSMVGMMVTDYQEIDSYVGLALSLFVIYLAIKMIVIAWLQRKSF